MSAQGYRERCAGVTARRLLPGLVFGLGLVTLVASCGKSPNCFDKCEKRYEECVKATGCGNVTCNCYTEKMACASGCYGSPGYALSAPDPVEVLVARPDSSVGSSYGARLIAVP